MSAVKCLVFGDVRGRVTELAAKLSQVDSKSGPFDLCLCVGDFFGPSPSPTALSAVRDGSVRLSVPTYFASPVASNPKELEAIPKGGRLADKLFYLGSGAGAKVISGLRIAFLSDDSDADAVAALVQMLDQSPAGTGVDVLLTAFWPHGITAGSQGTPSKASVASATLARGLRPRYHFAGTEGVYFARQPYRNVPRSVAARGSSKFFTTRFYGLADAFNTRGQKFLFAAGMTPIDSMASEQEPADATESPFVLAPSPNSSAAGRQSLLPAPQGGKNEQPFPKRRRVEGKLAPCWFCLGNPAVETHLVVSVGVHCYVALAKGPLQDGHVLVIPIDHQLSTESLPSAAREEIDTYVESIVRCIGEMLSRPAVAFERFTPSIKAQHTYVQIVPLVPGLESDAVERAFAEATSPYGAELRPIAGSDECKPPGTEPATAPTTATAQPGESYFWMRAPNGKRLAARGISPKLPFSLGREVAAMLCGMGDRTDWRKCLTTKEDETAQAARFKQIFAAYEPKAPQ